MDAPASSTRYCSRCLSTFDADQDRCPNLACRAPRPATGWGRMFGPGDIFDRHYRIHSLLALGGAGVTYLGREVGGDGEEVGPRLALKVLFASRDEGAYLRRLATEAQILQELDHPNIVQCLGFVHRAGHSPYLVTRYEAGGSLLDHIKRVGSLPVRRACQVARQVCWALDKAHAKGIVHRDLKPENVLLSRVVGPGEDPVVRVADFGIAKVQGALGGMTRVGAFVGTPLYAAPEQFIGASPTPAADVYAVGALLYFCTMVLPVVEFADRLEPADTYELLLQNLPPVVDRPHDDPEDVRRLNEVLAVCMAADPAQRCDIEELDGLLGSILAGRDPDVDALTSLGMPLVASPTLTADPDTHEGLLPASSPADRFGSVDHPARLPTPVPTNSEQAAEITAAEAARAGGGAQSGVDPVPGAPTADGSSSDPPASTADATASTADATAVRDEVRSSTPTRGRRGRGRSCLLTVLGGGSLAGVALVLLAWAIALRFAPGLLPSSLQLPPRTLDPGVESDGETIASLSAALADRVPRIAARCPGPGGRLTAVVTVQPSGRISAVTLQDVAEGVDGACVGGALAADPLPSPGWRAVRMAAALELPAG